MDIREELMADLKEAMKNKETVKKETVTGLRAAILQVEKDEQKELKEQEIFGIVAKEIKKRKDSLPDYEKAMRQDLLDKLYEEIKILKKYLPEQLSEKEIVDIVKEAIKQVGATSAKDMGKVMAEIRVKTQGKADGKIVSDIVKAELNSL